MCRKQKMGKENDIDDKNNTCTVGRGRSRHPTEGSSLSFPKALGSGFWSYLQIRKQKLRDATNLNSSRKSLDFNTSLSG